MPSKMKAILKTSAAIVAGAAVYAYLPLVSFALAPQAMGWLHVGLATIHPFLGEALLAGGVLYGVGSAIKRIWKNYFSEKKLEKKIEEVVEQKIAHNQDESKVKTNQKEQKKQVSKDNTVDPVDVPQKVTHHKNTEEQPVRVSKSKFKQNAFKVMRDKNQRKAA